MMCVCANLSRTLLCGNISAAKLLNYATTQKRWIDRCYATYVRFHFYNTLLVFSRKGHNACMTSTKVQNLERDGRSRSHLCFSPRAPWEVHYRSWTSSYLMHTDMIAHRCCCADELVGLLAASKSNRCRHRCGLLRGRDENARLHAQHYHRSRWKIIHTLLQIYWCQVFIPWFHFHCWKVTKQQNAVKCEYKFCWLNWDNVEQAQKHQRRIVVWFVHLKRGNILTTKLQDIESISLWVKGGGVSTGSYTSGAPLQAVQVQPQVVSPSLHLQLVLDQIPVTSDTSWVFFRPLFQLCATLRLSRRSCNKCQCFGSGCYL